MKLISIAFALFTLSGAAAFAEDSPCLKKEDVDAVLKEVNLVGDGWDELDLCASGTKTYRVLDALIFMKQISFKDKKKNLGPFDQQILSDNFWEYFTSHISDIVNEDCENPDMLAYVYGGLHDRIMHLCSSFYHESQNMYSRVSVMLHEARHFDGFSHVDCKRGYRKGQARACDTSFEEKGSYVVSVESSAKMAMFGEGIPQPMRALLKNQALLFADAFNTPILPQGFQSTYMVGRGREKAFLFDGAKAVEVPLIKDTRLISRSSALAAFPLDKSDAYTVDLYSKNFSKTPAVGLASTAYNKLEKSEREEILDILNGNGVNGVLFQNLVKLRPAITGGEYSPIELPFRAKQMFNPIELGIDSNDSVFIMSDQNKLFKVQLMESERAKIKQVPNILEKFNSIFLINDIQYALSKEGRVLVRDKKRWVSVPALKGIKMESATRSFNWTEYFVDDSQIY